MKINTSKISNTAWGDVDKSALGSKVADAYASGDITKAQIKQIYAFVPDEAFGEDKDGKPQFMASKAWGPHAEISDGEIVQNKGGVFAAAGALAGARSKPDLSSSEIATAKAALRKCYSQMNMDAPDSLKEAIKIGKGQPITELVKGSMQYTLDQMQDDFNDQFPSVWGMGMSTGIGMQVNYYIVDSFADYVIINGYGPDCDLDDDEYWKVPYTVSDGEYTFAPKEQWQVVELTYQPQTAPDVNEAKNKKRGKKFEERIGRVLLAEGEKGAKHIRANDVIVADVINGNGRRYPSSVIRSAVEEVRGHLNESAGQGRAIQYLGEAEHPSDKGTRRPNLLETVVKWSEISFDGRAVSLGGNILETSKGKDILALMEGNIQPGVSLRGYGETKTTKERGEKFDDVTELHITGFDLVLEPSFEQAEAVLESQNQSSEDEMTKEELIQLMKDQPDLFKGMTEAQLAKMGEAQLKTMEESVRKSLGLGAEANISESLKTMAANAKKFEEAEQKKTIDAAITEATKDLPYGKAAVAAFVEAVRAANPQDEKAVKTLVEGKRKEYDGLFSKARLQGMGKKEGDVQVIGSVLESETGTPEYARAAFQINESMNAVEMKTRRNLLAPKSPNEVFTKKMLERFDARHKYELMQESKMLAEADASSDLSLPYSVSRALIEQVWPTLVATGLIDTGVIDTSPTRIYYEKVTAEAGSTAVITGEAITALQGTWVALLHGALSVGAVSVHNGGTTYVEGTDYVVDYAAGQIKALATGAITNSLAVTVNYTYGTMRGGEMQAIPRSKMSLTFMVASAQADRVADQISREAILFGRSQINYDVQARMLVNIAKQIAVTVDKYILYAALGAVHSVANNHPASSWTAGHTQDDFDALVRLIGDTKNIVNNRYYVPTFILCSTTVAEAMTNWKGFTRLGFPDAQLSDLQNSAGYAGQIKGLPIYASVQLPDTDIIVGNRQLVMYRVFEPLQFFGPFPSYDSNGYLIAANQYYGEQFDVTVTPVPEKGAYLSIVGEPS